MSKVVKKGSKAPEMNMTPLIDVTFQLILFFMLVNNIIAEESMQMKVPRLIDPQTVEFGDEDRVVINVGHGSFDQKQRDSSPFGTDGKVGVIRVGIKEFNIADGSISVADALDAVTESLKESREKNENVEVVLRADAALHYDEVKPVIVAITEAGIKTTKIVAYLEEE